MYFHCSTNVVGTNKFFFFQLPVSRPFAGTLYTISMDFVLTLMYPYNTNLRYNLENAFLNNLTVLEFLLISNDESNKSLGSKRPTKLENKFVRQAEADRLIWTLCHRCLF